MNTTQSGIHIINVRDLREMLQPFGEHERVRVEVENSICFNDINESIRELESELDIEEPDSDATEREKLEFYKARYDAINTTMSDVSEIEDEDIEAFITTITPGPDGVVIKAGN